MGGYEQEARSIRIAETITGEDVPGLGELLEGGVTILYFSRLRVPEKLDFSIKYKAWRKFYHRHIIDIGAGAEVYALLSR